MPQGWKGNVLARLARSWVRHVLRPLAQRGRLRPGPLEGGRRLILVQMDGVSRRRMEWAMRQGHWPYLARLLDQGSLSLSSARSGAPTSTPAFQAGLFYGVSPSVPGFVWYDRRRQRQVRMDRASDAARIEAKLSCANPPLLTDGTSYFSIFSGGAALPHFCRSGRAGDCPRSALTADLSAFDRLANGLELSVTAARTAQRLASELVRGICQGTAWSFTLGRLKHEPRFLLHRLIVGAMRELGVEGVLLDIARGVPVVFCNFLGFDEFAHRRGPDAPEAVAHLRSMDEALACIAGASEAVPDLRYDLYVLSDHGHVRTEPFQSFTGLSLPDYLALADSGVAVPLHLPKKDAVRLARTQSMRAMLSSSAEPLRRHAGQAFDRAERTVVGHALGFARGDGVVTAEAGDVAHVYFTDESQPADLDSLCMRHPRALSAIKNSRVIGIVAARLAGRRVALIGDQRLDLFRPGDVARLPHPEPALFATYLNDLLSLPESGDLVVLGWRGEGLPPVAYAWEFGSHGGLGPEEIETFVLQPRRAGLPFSTCVRPSDFYRLFRDAYRRPEGSSAHVRSRRVRGGTG